MSGKISKCGVFRVDAPSVCPATHMELSTPDNVDNEAHLGANAGNEDDVLSQEDVEEGEWAFSVTPSLAIDMSRYDAQDTSSEDDSY